jgi:hypothetical protein
VECTFTARESLNKDARFFVYEYAHDNEVEEAKDVEDVKENIPPIKIFSIPSIDYEA